MKKLFIYHLLIGFVLGLVILFNTQQVQATGNFNICHYLPQLCEQPPIDVCSNLDGIQTQTPEGYTNEEGYCTQEEEHDYCETVEGVQKEDEDCPEQEVTPTVTPTPVGETNTGGASASIQTHLNDAPSVPQCVTPIKPAILYFAERVADGGIRFVWHISTDNPEKQSLLYGYGQNELSYSALDFSGNIKEFTVRGTRPNTHIWAVVRSYKAGCVADSNSFDP